MKYVSPSDRTAINPDYANGDGYYTTEALIAGMLQIPAFSDSTNPTEGEVGTIIKSVEDKIDSLTNNSWRPIIYRNEFHDFTWSGAGPVPRYNWLDYVGFVQLDHPNIRKVIRLEVFQGDSYVDLASATSSVTISDYTNVTSVTLTLPNSGLSFVLSTGTSAATFNASYGNRTAAQDLSYLINEVFPANTSTITNQTAVKAKQDSTAARNVSDFFFATVDSEDTTKIIISSLLEGEDGANCTIAISGSGLSKVDFTDQEDLGRLQNWWSINSEGRIFFRNRFPYQITNSIKVTYIAGEERVPAAISEIATKLACCEILRHDDSTILIGETGNQITPREKYDLLKLEADEMLHAYKSSVVFVA